MKLKEFVERLLGSLLGLGSVSNPDHEIAWRSARRTGIQVALACAGLVCAGAVLIFGYLWWKAYRTRMGDYTESDHVLISIDPLDLVENALIVGFAAVVLAGLATVVIARRALEPLRESLERQRSFVADASHELRTPLAVLNARAQYLQILTPQEDERREVVDELLGDTKILIDIVNDLLNAAARPSEEFVPVQVMPCIEGVQADMSVLAKKHGVEIDLDIGHGVTSDVRAAMPETAFRRCLVAVLNNAMNHTPTGGRIRIIVKSENARIVVRINDNGSGIVGIEPDRIFERFAHGSQEVLDGSGESGNGVGESSDAASSHGIGLALVRDIMSQYEGSVKLIETGPSGTTFELCVPLMVPCEKRRARP